MINHSWINGEYQKMVKRREKQNQLQKQEDTDDQMSTDRSLSGSND